MTNLPMYLHPGEPPEVIYFYVTDNVIAEYWNDYASTTEAKMEWDELTPELQEGIRNLCLDSLVVDAAYQIQHRLEECYDNNTDVDREENEEDE